MDLTSTALTAIANLVDGKAGTAAAVATPLPAQPSKEPTHLCKLHVSALGAVPSDYRCCTNVPHSRDGSASHVGTTEALAFRSLHVKGKNCKKRSVGVVYQP